MPVFAERLKNLRDSRGQTQGEVGKAVGKSRESVSKYEIGDREPDTEAIAAIAKHFNVSADYILGISDEAMTLNEGLAYAYSIEILKYDKYLRDEGFTPYLRVAVRMKDNNVEIMSVERFIHRYVKNNKK